MFQVQSQVVLYKILQAVALIAPTLPLTITLRCLRVGLPVLLLVAGMRVPPLFAALLNDLRVERIGTNLLVMIVALSLPLAGGLVTNGLLGMKARRLEDLLAIRATAITHQVAPDQNASSSFCPEPAEARVADEKVRRVQSFYRMQKLLQSIFTASPPMGPVLIKPAGLLLFQSGTDTGPISRDECVQNWDANSLRIAFSGNIQQALEEKTPGSTFGVNHFGNQSNPDAQTPGGPSRHRAERRRGFRRCVLAWLG